MSRICENCGAPEAVLYAFYPATLCRECVAIRVAERKADEAYREAEQQRKAAESAPDPRMMFTEPDAEMPTAEDDEASTPDETQEQRLARSPSSRKRSRKARRGRKARIKQRREDSIAAFAVMQQTLPSQASLIRVHIHAGNHDAALLMAKALLVAFVRTGYSSLTGVMVFAWPTDRMVSRLRTGELIDSAALTAMVAALSSRQDDPASAGLFLNAVEILAFGAESESGKARQSRRRRILSEGERLAQSCDVEPAVEVTGGAQ